MPQQRGGQRHAAQRAAAPHALQALLPVDVGGLLGGELPFADQCGRKLFDVMQFRRTAHGAARHGVRSSRSNPIDRIGTPTSECRMLLVSTRKMSAS